MENKKDSHINEIILRQKKGSIAEKEIIYTPLGQRPVGTICAHSAEGEEIQLYSLFDANGNLLCSTTDRQEVEEVAVQGYMLQMLVTAGEKWREEELARARSHGQSKEKRPETQRSQNEMQQPFSKEKAKTGKDGAEMEFACSDIILERQIGFNFNEDIKDLRLGSKVIGTIHQRFATEDGNRIPFYILSDVHGHVLAFDKDRTNLENVTTIALISKLREVALDKWREDELLLARANSTKSKEKTARGSKAEKDELER